MAGRTEYCSTPWDQLKNVLLLCTVHQLVNLIRIISHPFDCVFVSLCTRAVVVGQIELLLYLL